MSTPRVIIVIVLTGIASVLALWVGAFLFTGFALSMGMERHLGSDEDEQPFFPVSAVLVVDVDHASGPRRGGAVVLRLDPLDQDAMGLDNYLVQPDHWGDFELHTTHVLETRSEVYEHCIVAEAVLYDHSYYFNEYVIPSGTCLRSDAPLEVVLER